MTKTNMYKVYLSSDIMGLRNHKFLFETENKNALTRLIGEELTNLGFRHNGYWRYTDLIDKVSIDFGSWSQFIIIEGITFAELLTMEEI